MILFINKVGDSFNCNQHLMGDDEIYICVYGVRVAAIFCNIVFLVGLILQAVVVYYGNMTTTTAVDGRLRYPSLMLMLNFLDSSQPSIANSVIHFVQYVLSDEFVQSIEDNMEVIVNKEAFELIEIKREITKHKQPEALNYLTSADTVFNEKIVIETIQQTTYTILECLPLAALLAKHELWKVFVMVIRNVDSDLENLCQEVTAEVQYYFTLMDVNFDSIETPSKEVKYLKDDPSHNTVVPKCSGSSLLYYAITMSAGKQTWVVVTKFLLKFCKPQIPYVHRYLNHGEYRPCESVSAEDFIVIESWKSDFNATASDIEDVKREITLCSAKAVEENSHRCQQEIRLHLAEYKQVTRYSKENPKFKKYIDVLPLLLARKKFRIWDENASTFLSLASKNQHDGVSMALLFAVFHTSPIRCLANNLPDEKILQMAMSSFEFELEDCKELVKYLVENEVWGTLIKLLNNVNTDLTTCNEEQLDFYRRLNINLDSLGQSYAVQYKMFTTNFDHCCSILFYALKHDTSSTQSPFAIANFILKISNPQRLYIHTTAKSFEALQYIETELQNIKRDVITKTKLREFKIALQKFEEDAQNSVGEFPCQKQIHELYLRYKEKIGSIDESVKNDYTLHLASILHRHRFSIWDDSATAFANMAATNSHWSVVTSLLNGFIVTDVEKIESGILNETIEINKLDNIDAIWGCIIADELKSNGNVTNAVRYVIRNSRKNIYEVMSRLDKRQEEYYCNVSKVADKLACN